MKRDFRTLELAHYQISHLSRDDPHHKAFSEERGLFLLISKYRINSVVELESISDKYADANYLSGQPWFDTF